MRKPYFTKDNFRTNQKAFPAYADRSLTTLSEAGFAYWKNDGTCDNDLVGNPAVQVLPSGGVAVYHATGAGYEGFGEYCNFNPTMRYSHSGRIDFAWCLIDYTVVLTTIVPPSELDVWPVLHVVDLLSHANMISLRMTPLMIRDQETAPFYEMIGFANPVDAVRNKLLMCVWRYNVNTKAISLYAWDSNAGALTLLVYSMHGGSGPGWGNMIPMFGCNPSSGIDNGYVIINDFRVSENYIPYGTPPITL